MAADALAPSECYSTFEGTEITGKGGREGSIRSPDANQYFNRYSESKSLLLFRDR